MAVKLANSPSKDITITVKEVGTEVHIICNGFAFARLYTNNDGKHMIVVKDIDTGTRYEQDIQLLCWAH